VQVEGETYQLKPMNCPFHVEIYKNGYYSYRDLPLRWAELGTVYRYERSGAMQGLFRVRGFTQVFWDLYERRHELWQIDVAFLGSSAVGVIPSSSYEWLSLCAPLRNASLFFQSGEKSDKSIASRGMIV
jgi:hypothetical protein